jgi:hypothetical protein
VADVVIGVLLVGLAGAVLWLSSDISAPPFVPLSPAFFPRILAGILAGLSLLLVARAVRGLPAARGGRGPLGPAAVVFGSLAAYIFAIPRLGFYASTFLFLLVLGTLLGDRTKAALLRALGVAAAATVGCFVVFTRYLNLLLPEGILR